MSNRVINKTYYEIPICFSCLKVVNLKYLISSKGKDNYRYIICNCGQIMKVTKENNEEKISRLKRNSKDLNEAYELFFQSENNKNKKVESKYKFKSIKEIINSKKEYIKIQKREKKKSRLKIVK